MCIVKREGEGEGGGEAQVGVAVATELRPDALELVW